MAALDPPNAIANAEDPDPLRSLSINVTETEALPVKVDVEIIVGKSRFYMDMVIPSNEIPIPSSVSDFCSISDRLKTHYLHPTLDRLSLIYRPSTQGGLFADSDDDNRRTIRCLSMGLVDCFIRFAATIRLVKEIELTFLHPFAATYDSPRVPQSLVTVCSTNLLTSLKLTSLSFPRLPKHNNDHFSQGKYFPNLKILELNYVFFSNSNDLSLLFSSCSSSLEDLTIQKSHWVPNVMVMPNSFPNLVRFKFVDCEDSLPGNLSIESASPKNINTETPLLEYLYFDGSIQCLNLRNCPNLHTAHIRSSGKGLLSCQRLIDIFEVFKNVEVLSVGHWFFVHFHHWHWKHKDGLLCRDFPPCDLATYQIPKLEKLREFHCHGILLQKFTMRALLIFVSKCPLLEKLCINLDFYSRLPERAEREEFYARFKCKHNPEKDIFEDYDYSGGVRLLSWEDVLARRREEEHKQLTRVDHGLKLKTISLTQFFDKRTSMGILRFILPNSPALESMLVNFVDLQAGDISEFRHNVSLISHAAPQAKVDIKHTEVAAYEQSRGSLVNTFEFIVSLLRRLEYDLPKFTLDVKHALIISRIYLGLVHCYIHGLIVVGFLVHFFRPKLTW